MAAKGSSSTPPGVILTPNEYKEYLHLTQAAKYASISFVAQTVNAFACLSHSSEPWILDFGALVSIFLDHSHLFCLGMRFFIKPLALILLDIMEWLSTRTVIWLKLLALSYSIIRFLNVFGGMLP